MSIEAMKQARDVLLTLDNDLVVEVTKLNAAIDALDDAIEYSESEWPVAEIKGFDGNGAVLRWFTKSTDFPAGAKFYTTPQSAQKPWVGLTNEEIFETHKQVDSMQYLTFGKAIEAKLKEKNT